MGKIRIVGRRAERDRCPYCRERADGAPECAGCGTPVHRDCRAELGRCPTLGCGGAAAFAPQAPRQEARRAHRAGGRLTREPPPLWARFGPYTRLTVRAILQALILVACVGLVLACFYAIWLALTGSLPRRPEPGQMFAGLVMLVSGVCGVGYAGVQLHRTPATFRAVTAALDDGEVVRANLSVYSQREGKHHVYYARVLPQGARVSAAVVVRLGLVLAPFWLFWSRSGQEVFVHGWDRPGPLVIEFRNGFLALLDR